MSRDKRKNKPVGEPDGVTSQLARLLEQYGFQRVETRPFPLRFRAGTAEGERFAENLEHVFRTGVPFLRKWASVPDDYDGLCQQMQREMRQPDFEASMPLLTAWGQALFP